MLRYDGIDISEGIDINKTSASKEWDICHYLYFKDISFKYEPYLCNGCYDLMQKAMNFNDVAIVSVKGSDYRINFWHMSRSDVISIMNNSNLSDKKGVLQVSWLIYKNDCKQFRWKNLLPKNRDVILNRAKDHYENDKKRLSEQAEIYLRKKKIKYGRN